MVEVIHAYNKIYPFGLHKDSENTYVQQSRLILKQMDISLFRQKAKIYQEMDNLFFIRMIKVLKEDNNLHFVYQYYETSLQKYLGNLKKSVGFTMTRELYKSFLNDFTGNINDIINSLIHSQIKAVLLLDNIACYAKNEKNYNFSLKAFIDTEAEYLSITKHNYEPKEPKQKDQRGRNQQYLFQFYDAERKRLAIQFEQLSERIFGKINETTQRKQTPNFIINGTKLIFINKDQKQQEEHEPKNNQNPKEDQKPKPAEKQQKQSSSKRIETLSEKNQGEKSPKVKKVEKKKIQGPIIDFDQSFQPDFKPQQFTKQKTFIYEENDYLDSLEQQLKKIAAEKKQNQTKKPQSCHDFKVLKMQQNKKYSNEQVMQSRHNKIKNLSKQSQDHTKNQSKQKNNDSINQTRMIQSTNSNTSNQNNSNNQSTDKKTEKVNKYKMKIITSHEIQIQGGGEQPNVQEIEKEIINNIKNGKINLKDLGNSQKNNSNSKNQSEESTSKNNISGNSLNGNSKEQQSNKTKLHHDNGRVHTQEIQKKQKGQTESKQILKLKQPPPNKPRTINQIIQRIGINTNLHNQNGQNYQKKQDRIDIRPESKAGFQAKAVRNQLQESNKKQTLQFIEKIDKNDAADNETKNEKAQNYINKIKQAKNKAQQLLREYTKKKQ